MLQVETVPYDTVYQVQNVAKWRISSKMIFHCRSDLIEKSNVLVIQILSLILS